MELRNTERNAAVGSTQASVSAKTIPEDVTTAETALDVSESEERSIMERAEDALLLDAMGEAGPTKAADSFTRRRIASVDLTMKFIFRF